MRSVALILALRASFRLTVMFVYSGGTECSPDKKILLLYSSVLKQASADPPILRGHSAMGRGSSPKRPAKQRLRRFRFCLVESVLGLVTLLVIAYIATNSLPLFWELAIVDSASGGESGSDGHGRPSIPQHGPTDWLVEKNSQIETARHTLTQVTSSFLSRSGADVEETLARLGNGQDKPTEQAKAGESQRHKGLRSAGGEQKRTVRTLKTVAPWHSPRSFLRTHLRALLPPTFFEPHSDLQRNHRISRSRHHMSSSQIDSASTSSNVAQVKGTHGAGLCIAITSAPRTKASSALHPNPMAPWEYVERLVRLLDERRAKGALLERDMWAVVHASGCEVQPGEGEGGGGASPTKADLRSDVGATDSLAEAEQLRGVAHGQVRGKEGRQQRVQRLMRVSLNGSQAYVDELLGVLEDSEWMRAQGQLARQHLAAVMNASGAVEMETYVLPGHREACRLIQDAEVLLGTVPPDRVAADGWERWLWRTKLAMDFVYVMHQCMATNPKHILLLQDDTTPAELWDVGIERFIVRDLRGKPGWLLLSLYNPESYGVNAEHGEEYGLPCCAQALLFNASAVPPLLEYMEEEFMNRPMDHNIRRYLEDTRSHAYVHVPSLFQHEGLIRTNNLEVKYHRDRKFKVDTVKMPYEREVDERGGRGGGRVADKLRRPKIKPVLIKGARLDGVREGADDVFMF